MTLGEDMKAEEKLLRSYVEPKKYLIVRLDGKAFHSYTKGLDRPYDSKFMDDMDGVAQHLCSSVSNIKMAFIQSDEISLLVTDWSEDKNTQQLLGGQIQKIVSITAGAASTAINFLRPPVSLRHAGVFDSRVITFSTHNEAESYFVWRQMDGIKNSVSMAAETKFSSRELMGKTSDDRLQKLQEVGYPWEALPEGFKYGRLVTKEFYPKMIEIPDRATGGSRSEEVLRTRWVANPAPDFKLDFGRAQLQGLIPEKLADLS